MPDCFFAHTSRHQAGDCFFANCIIDVTRAIAGAPRDLYDGGTRFFRERG
jgi:hypothetical protein